MTSDAGNLLPRTQIGQRAHRLIGAPFVVQNLEENRLIGGNAEIGGTVRLDRNGAENRPAILLTRQANRRIIAGRFRKNLNDANFLNILPFDAVAEPFANVGNRDLPPIGPLGGKLTFNDRRRGIGADRNRIHRAKVRVTVDQLPVAVGIEQVKSERVRGRHGPFGRERRRGIGDEEQILRERIGGFIKLRNGNRAMRFIGLRVGNFRGQIRQPLQTVHPGIRVEQHQRSAGRRVMRGCDKDELSRPRNRLNRKGRKRLRRRVSPHGPRIRSIGARGPEILMRNGVPVDVIPAGVIDQAGFIDHREPFVRIVEGKRFDILPVAVAPMQCVGIPAFSDPPPMTAAIRFAPGRAEDDPAVGKPVRHGVVE